MGRPKKDQEPEFATHLSPDLIGKVQALSRRYCRRFVAFGYGWEDVAQQTIELLLKRCQAGKLHVKITNEFVIRRIQDSIRTLQGGRHRDPLGLFAAEDIEVARRHSKDHCPPFEKDIGANAQIKELAEGMPLVDQARLRYEAADCNWSKDFHNWLGDVLKGIQEESVRVIHAASLTRDAALAVNSRNPTVAFGTVEERLIKWISANKGRYFTHSVIGREIGSTRETVSKLLRSLIKSERATQHRKSEGDSTPEGDKGRYSYSLVGEGAQS